MGLDNGIEIYCKDIKKFVMDIPSYIVPPFSFNSDIQSIIEMAYFRKFWGFRSEVSTVLKFANNNVKINKEELSKIIDILKKFLNPEYYNEHANSVFEWESYFDYMIQCYMNLCYIYSVWDNYEDFTVIWYDSY